MGFHFCPQCGTKLQPDFRFCPFCGEKLPSPFDESGSLNSMTISRDEAATSSANTSPGSSKNWDPIENMVSARPALRKTRKTLDKAVRFNIRSASPDAVPSTHFTSDEKTESNSNDNVGCQGSPLKWHTVTVKSDAEGLTSEFSSSAGRSPRTVRGKMKLSSPAKEQTDGITEDTTVGGSSSNSSPISRSPLKGRSKAKKAKIGPAVEPLQEGEEVTDTTGKKWKLTKLLSQSTTELLYEVSRPNSKESDHILKLAAKDGRIFNEQNFLQRAAKPASVDKWIKQNKMDFLGIPPCIGFGLHADTYRFLIFPDIGRSLLSVIEEENKLLPEKVVLQLACRLLDVLQFIHSNEYVHADINAENIYVKPGQKSQVYLVGYCHAFRYCPGGQHVEYREASRTPHEGAVEFISLDTHKGAAPSRRSDLQSLGYCMLHWLTGQLPWTKLTQPDQVAAQKQRFMEDVNALLSHCFGKKKIPSAFQTYLMEVMALQYSEQPDYSGLMAGLSDALQKLGGLVELPLNL